MLAPRPNCPRCRSQYTVLNGRIHNKKPKYQCQDCKRQFVEKSTKKVIDQETLELIDRLLLEKIPLAGIARATQVSETWLQKYVNDKYVQVPQQVQVSAKPKGKLTIECDYEVQRNLYIQVAREFIIEHLKPSLGVNAHHRLPVIA